MPNWCSNKIYFNIELNKDVLPYLNNIKDNFEKGNFNNFFIPKIDDFSKNRDNWGTKWDIDPICFNIDISEDNVNVSCGFDTAWGPNIPVSKVFFESLKKIGNIKDYEHEYHELGNAFYGKFDGDSDKCKDMGIMYLVLNEYIESYILESDENNILKFEDFDYMFLIKEEFYAELSYFDDKFKLKAYRCFSETFGDNIVFYKYRNEYFSKDIY